jgi:hypothetical protein
MSAASLARPAARVTAAALLLAAAAAPAEAQFLKRVKQMAQDKAAQVVARGAADRVADDDAVAAGAAGAAAPGGAAGAAPAKKGPTPITAERLELFFTAMRPAMARAERGRAEFEARKAYDRLAKEYDAKAEAWQTCSERVMTAAGPPSMQQQMRMAQESERGAKLMARFAAESQHGYTERVRALEDSMKVEQLRVAVIVYPQLKGCGPTPKQPDAPKRTEESTPEQLITPPAGMTRGQFGRLRERVAVYALTGGKDDPFTAEERAALDARAADLAKFAPLFRDGLLEWGQWGKESELGKAWSVKPAGS